MLVFAASVVIMTPATVETVARMRLVAHGLIEPLPTPLDAARHLTCAQGQDLPGALTSLALRTTGRSLDEVRAAFDAGHLVRTWPMRGTLFVVPAEDAGWVRELTAAKVLQSTERRRVELGLDAATIDRAEAVARERLAGAVVGDPASGLVRAELLDAWQEAGLATDAGRGYHLLFHLALRGVLVQGPMAGKEQRFVLAEEWVATPRTLEREEAVRELLRRYVAARGPVPVEDFCWWSKLTKAEARAALAGLSGELSSIEVDGRTHWMAPDLRDRYAEGQRATATPLLLPGFDEVVLGYGDRAAVLTPQEEQLVVPGKNGMFKGTVLHKGHAVGTWRRPTRTGAPVAVEPFSPRGLPAPVENALPRLTASLPA